MARFAPNLGALLQLAANHTLMHAGQFTSSAASWANRCCSKWNKYERDYHPAAPPEHNMTGVDFNDRGHLRYAGPPLIDIHSHVMQTRPGDPKDGPPPGSGPGPALISGADAGSPPRSFLLDFGCPTTFSRGAERFGDARLQRPDQQTRRARTTWPTVCSTGPAAGRRPSFGSPGRVA